MSRKKKGGGVMKWLRRLLRMPALIRVIIAGRRNRLTGRAQCCAKIPRPPDNSVPDNSVPGKNPREGEDKLWQQAG